MKRGRLLMGRGRDVSHSSEAMLSVRTREGSTLFAERVLVSPIAPGFDFLPRLRCKKPIHFARGKHPGAGRFAVTVLETGQADEEPHREERNRRPKRPARFSNKATATGLEHTIHFRNRLSPVRQDREKTRRDEHIERVLRVRKLKNVVALEAAVVQAECISLLAGPT